MKLKTDSLGSSILDVENHDTHDKMAKEFYEVKVVGANEVFTVQGTVEDMSKLFDDYLYGRKPYPDGVWDHMELWGPIKHGDGSTEFVLYVRADQLVGVESECCCEECESEK